MSERNILLILLVFLFEAHGLTNGSSFGKKGTLLVLMSGTLQRYHLSSSAKHFVSPLVKDGWGVDYYLALSTAENTTWKESIRQNQVDSFLDGIKDPEKLAEAVAIPLREAGARVKGVDVFESVSLMPNDWDYVIGGSMWNRVDGRGETARKNFLQMHKKLESIWEKAKSSGDEYLYTVVLRDDIYWITDFDFGKMLQIGGAIRTKGSQGKIYNLLCSAKRSTFVDSAGLTDYIFIVNQEASRYFMSWYSHIIRPDKYGRSWYSRSSQYVNSEQMGLHLADHYKLTVESVPPILIPIQRLGRVHDQLCVHKACDANFPAKHLDYLQSPFTKPCDST